MDASSLHRLLRFTWQQAAALFGSLLAAMGGALLLSCWRRRLRLRAVLAAAATVAAGAAAFVGLLAWQGLLRSPATWPVPCAAAAAVAVLSGAAAARRTRDLAVVELQASALLTAALAGSALAQPWARWRGARITPWAPALGEMWGGTLWPQALAAAAALGFALSLWGASLQLTWGGRAVGERRLWPWHWRLEWRLLRARLGKGGATGSHTSRIATLGMALGVAALIVVTAVMSGYQRDIEARILGTNAHVVLQKYGSDFEEGPALTSAVRAIPGVLASAPFVFNEALLAAGGKSHGVLLKGIVPESTEVTDIARQICVGVQGQGPAALCLRLPHAQQRAGWPLAAGADAAPRVIVGLSLFRALNVPLGAPVQLLTPTGLGAVGRRTTPKRERFVVAGVFDSGMHEFDSHLVYAPLAQAQALLGLGRSISGLEIRVQEPMRADAVGEAILSAVGHYPYRALDWRALNRTIFTAISLQKAAMVVLLSFIVVVASFNIASTLMMAAMQRSKDVAVLKSLGTTEASILRVTVFEGLLIALAGCAAGLALGIGVALCLSQLDLSIAADVYMVGALTLALDVREVAGIVGLAFAIGQIASLVPALSASKASPMELFRQQ